MNDGKNLQNTQWLRVTHQNHIQYAYNSGAASLQKYGQEGSYHSPFHQPSDNVIRFSMAVGTTQSLHRRDVVFELQTVPEINPGKASRLT
ncbi:hypothetical protein ACFX13_027921 [Malus domestica]